MFASSCDPSSEQLIRACSQDSGVPPGMEVNAFLVLFLVHFISTTTLSFFLNLLDSFTGCLPVNAVARVRWDAARSGHLVLPWTGSHLWGQAWVVTSSGVVPPQTTTWGSSLPQSHMWAWGNWTVSSVKYNMGEFKGVRHVTQHRAWIRSCSSGRKKPCGCPWEMAPGGPGCGCSSRLGCSVRRN